MSKKIIFMGTPYFAVPILKSLYQNGYVISVVYTQPPKKSDRGQKINKSPVQVMSETLNLDFRTPHTLKNNFEEYEYLKKLKADLGIVVAYGQIIPKEFLKLCNKGFINIHGSILPKWRGAAPIQRSIMNLDKEIGISIMKIVEKLDVGPVCNIYKINLDTNENAQVVSEKLSLLAAEKILYNIDEIFQDKPIIIAKINGLYPSPSAFFIFNGERYKILRAEVAKGIGKVGEVISDKLEIACGENQSIKILEIQREGKRPQNINEFAFGSQIKKGTVIPNV